MLRFKLTNESLMNTQLKSILAQRLAKKGKKPNGFTLIELMVVVAIVGILSGVGLPQLLKAQDKAKDSVAIATLTNAAKECSLLLVTEGNGDNFDNGTESNYSVGDGLLGKTVDRTKCATEETMTLASESADGTVFEITFDQGGIPGPYVDPRTAAGDDTTTPVT